MIRHCLLFIIICVIFFNTSGCFIYDKFRSVSASMSEKIRRKSEKSVVKTDKEIKNDNKGYLSKNINLPHQIKKTDSESGLNNSLSTNIKNNELSKVELTRKVKELEEQIMAEKSEKDRALNELSAFKVEFQKEIFTLSNQLEQEKNRNREISEKIVSTEMSAIKAKQELSDVKAYIVMQRNLFQSSYPVFYEVQKGDSLWKIAAKKEIYDNSYKWTEIFHANKGKLDDKDLIYPGMILNIPRYHEFLLSNFNDSNIIFNNDIKSNNNDNIEVIKE